MTPIAAAKNPQSPYGGSLVDLIVSEERANAIKAASKDYVSLTLDERSLCDLELLAVGGLSPLRSFMGQKDYESVLNEMRLADGTFWPLPVTLPVDLSTGVEVGQPVALRDVYGNLVGLLQVEEIYAVNKEIESRAIYGTTDAKHSAVAALDRSPSHYAGGKLEVIRVPPHFDFVPLRRTPADLHEQFAHLGWSKVVAYQTSSPLYRAEEELTKRAAKAIGAGLLIQPVVGTTKPGDVEHYTRLRCYRAVVESAFAPGTAVLSLLPFATRHAGLRESLLQAIICRNYGCTDLIVSQEIDQKYMTEIGVGIIPVKPLVYLSESDQYVDADEIPAGAKTAVITEDQVEEEFLARGIPLPDWFCRPEVSAILNESRPPRHKQGLTIWFTGLSGSGKSTVAHGLVERLAEFGRNVAFLDGDEIRTHLSKGLSFSKEDRDTNINRVGYVAGLLAAQGGTTICSVISPYRKTRDNARKSSRGNFVEVFCDTPIAVCETRDVKGLYNKARAAVAEGKGMGFTGVDDPYEVPVNPEVTLDTSKLGVTECVDVIVAKLKELGYIKD